MQTSASLPLGGKLSLIVFLLTLFAFVAESQLTQYVQANLGFRKPFFILYLVHGAFVFALPLHLLLLFVTTRSIQPYLQGLIHSVARHLGDGQAFPIRKFLYIAISLTIGITAPAMLWFSAISLASISDVSSIWNTNALFAYLMTTRKWEPRRFASVCVATLGTMVVIYGGSTKVESPVTESALPSTATNPLLGDLMTVVASLGYALYQVMYKRFAALPSPESTEDELYEPLPVSDSEPVANASSPMIDTQKAIAPPPFGLHANMMSSAIGLCTLLVLWVIFPCLHYSGLEPFTLPPDLKTAGAIAAVAFSGLIFNGGLMILLGVWGPVMTSVGNLLTIVLVFCSDIIWGAGLQAVTLWSVIGSGMIVVAFAVLAHDMYTHG